MAYVVRFAPSDMTTDQYDECMGRLGATGNFPPPGLEYHVCFKVDGKLAVSDIWTSKEEFEEFGKMLMPILADLGADPGEPAFLEIHNQIKG